MKLLIDDLLHTRASAAPRCSACRSTPTRSSPACCIARGRDPRERRDRRRAARSAPSTATATQIGQLLQNLIANAIKFARARRARRGAHRARRRPREWHVVVRDNGIGIEERHAERIFKMFGRLHAPRGVRGHRHRPGDLPPDRRPPRRPHLGRVDARLGLGVPRLDPGRAMTSMPAIQTSPVAAKEALRVLSVEDNPGDAILVREMLRDASPAVRAAERRPALGGRRVPARRRASTACCSISACPTPRGSRR